MERVCGWCACCSHLYLRVAWRVSSRLNRLLWMNRCLVVITTACDMIVGPESTPATVKSKAKGKTATSTGANTAPHKLSTTLADFALSLLDVEEGLARGRVFQPISAEKTIEHLVQSITKTPSSSNTSAVNVNSSVASEQSHSRETERSTVRCFSLQGSSHQGISAASIDSHCQALAFADPHGHSLYISEISLQSSSVTDVPRAANDQRVNESSNFTSVSSGNSPSKCESTTFQSPTTQPITFIGHTPGVIFDLAFVPKTDSSGWNNLITACEDGNVYAWSIEPSTESSDEFSDGESSTYKVNQVNYTGGHLFPVWCCDVSPLSLYFASGSADTTVKLWDFSRKFPLRMFAGHSMDVDVVKFHPNCKYLASGSSDRSVRLWSVADGRNVRLFPGHTSHITCLAFTPDGQQLISSESNVIKVWDMKMCKQQREMKLDSSDQITSMVLHNSLCIVTCTNGSVKLYDFTKGTLNYECRLDSIYMLGSRVAAKPSATATCANPPTPNSNSKSSTFVNNSLFVFGYSKAS